MENLVVPSPPPAALSVKGIDLESAVRAGRDAVDYSPEVCPPEFAREYESNGGEGFKVRDAPPPPLAKAKGQILRRP